MPTPFDLTLPRAIRFGRGVSNQLLAEMQRLRRSRPLVLVDPGVRRAGLLSKIIVPLEEAGVAVTVFDRIESEPPFACVADAVAAGQHSGVVDLVIAIGGGSVIDAAKLVAVTLTDRRDPRVLVGIGKIGYRETPLICIPTTAGTGSEATPVAIFTDLASSNKVGIVDACLVPDVVLLDPCLTDGLPALPTAAAGMDALVHALEAFIARTATPLSRGLALEAARHLGSALPRVCANGADLDARDAMLLGANLAGLAFANSSCCAVHALALPLGARFHIPHGVVTGCLVSETMRHNLPACTEDLGRFAVALGLKETDPEQFPGQLRQLSDAIGLRKVLLGAGATPTALPELARAAVANRRLIDPNPRPISESEAIGIYRRTLGFDD